MASLHPPFVTPVTFDERYDGRNYRCFPAWKAVTNEVQQARRTHISQWQPS